MSLAVLEVAQRRMDAFVVIASETAGAMAGNVARFAEARALGVERFRSLIGIAVASIWRVATWNAMPLA